MTWGPLHTSLPLINSLAEITNGKPDGFGFMTYPYDGKSVMGEWKNGKEWNTKHTKKPLPSK